MEKFIEVEADRILEMFASLNSKNQKKAHRQALSKALSILIKQAKANLKGKVNDAPTERSNWKRKTRRPIMKGIRSSIDRDAIEGKAHIMGDFRLKWFEKGTVERWGKKNPNKYSGRIKPLWFFKSAREQKESEISKQMEQILSQSIRKIYEKS